jgi:hypothetical protein
VLRVVRDLAFREQLGREVFREVKVGRVRPERPGLLEILGRRAAKASRAELVAKAIKDF